MPAACLIQQYRKAGQLASMLSRTKRLYKWSRGRPCPFAQSTTICTSRFALVVQRSSEKLFSRLVARFDTDTSPSSTRTKASTRTSLRGLPRRRHAISLVVIIIGATTRLAHCLFGPSSVSSFRRAGEDRKTSSPR